MEPFWMGMIIGGIMGGGLGFGFGLWFEEVDARNRARAERKAAKHA